MLSTRASLTVLLAEPVVAHVVAVVAREHDQCVVEPALGLQKLHEAADVVVDLLDETHVGRGNRKPHLLLGEQHALGVLHKCLEDRVSILPLCLAADRGNAVLRTVHVMIGRRHDVRPMGLDVADVQDPGLIALHPDELHGLVRRPSRLAVFLWNARGLARIPHVPT